MKQLLLHKAVVLYIVAGTSDNVHTTQYTLYMMKQQDIIMKYT